MAWDFAETNLLEGVVNLESSLTWVTSALRKLPPDATVATASQLDAAAAVARHKNVLVCTDPPYYDNIGYADLSDMFYIWLRRMLTDIYPDLFSTLLTPKATELIATPFRFDGNRRNAREFFEQGLKEVFEAAFEAQDVNLPMVIYYAFKQSDSDGNGEGPSSTGWETMLEALLASGFSVTGTWPLRTEQQQRSVAAGTNALASSIILVCRPRPAEAAVATRREFVNSLKRELPDALRVLQHGNIAPVDLAQAAIGPGMATFSRYVKVVEASGERMPVRAALGLINQALDEVLGEQETDFDPATRFAIAWFGAYGLDKGPYGEAQVLATAKGTTPEALDRQGFLEARAGKVRLLGWWDLPEAWDPASDTTLTYWEATHHLIRAHQHSDGGSERAAADLLYRMSGYGEPARELAYRLYVTCERRSWAELARPYNTLVVAWPEIIRLADATGTGPEQTTFGG